MGIIAVGATVMKFGNTVGRRAAAIVCALILVLSGSAAAYADDTVFLPGIEEPAPTPSDGETTEPTDPGTTDPGTTDPGTTDPGTTDPGTTDPGTTDPGTIPGTGGSVPVKPLPKPPVVAPTVPKAPAPAPVQPSAEAPAPAQTPAEETVQEPGIEEAVPLETPSPATSTAPAVKKPESTKKAAPLPVPEPVARTIESVVSVATGSPLYVQLLTIVGLLGAGFLYFRFMGSKARRSPVRGHK
jgi:hypothetical protein